MIDASGAPVAQPCTTISRRVWLRVPVLTGSAASHVPHRLMAWRIIELVTFLRIVIPLHLFV
jgi:hypothetical protein